MLKTRNSRNSRVPIEFDEEERRDYKEAFALLDKTATGTITKDELKGAVEALGQHLTDHEYDDIIDAVVKDRTGEIGFPEFLELIRRKMQAQSDTDNVDELWKMFSRGRGFVTGEDLYHVMNGLGEDVTKEEVDEILKDASEAAMKANKLNYDEFRHVFDKN